MRRTRDDLLQGITLAVPAEPGRLFTALCDAMARRHGVPVEHRVVPFPVSTVSGLMVKTKSRNLILIESDTDPEHQLCILGHEFWHIEADGPRGAMLGDEDYAALLSPGITAADVDRIAERSAARTDCEKHEEAECELFGSLLAMKSKHWLNKGSTMQTPTSSFGRKLSVSLGPGGGTW